MSWSEVKWDIDGRDAGQDDLISGLFSPHAEPANISKRKKRKRREEVENTNSSSAAMDGENDDTSHPQKRKKGTSQQLGKGVRPSSKQQSPNPGGLRSAAKGDTKSIEPKGKVDSSSVTMDGENDDTSHPQKRKKGTSQQLGKGVRPSSKQQSPNPGGLRSAAKGDTKSIEPNGKVDSSSVTMDGENDDTSHPQKRKKGASQQPEKCVSASSKQQSPNPGGLRSAAKGDTKSKEPRAKEKKGKAGKGLPSQPAVLASAIAASPALNRPQGNQAKKGKLTLQEKLRSRLDSGRFRYVNEQLYTSTSAEAVSLFKKEPKLFDIYHDGFATQVSKWPVNPLDQIVAWLRMKPSSLVVADMGCGEGQLALSVQQKVHSFDLVATRPHVIAGDMSHVALKRASVDIVVFCLSLMGTNLDDFVQEAHRILRPSGLLRVAEVKSRIDDIDEFCSAICDLGFQLKGQDERNRMFVSVEFVKAPASQSTLGQQLSLKPCLYKKR